MRNVIFAGLYLLAVGTAAADQIVVGAQTFPTNYPFCGA